jgi:hypothetical protein
MIVHLRIVTIALLALTAVSVCTVAPAVALDDDDWIQNEHQPPRPPPVK